jgi:dihydrodipicolinate synthase/N-acetylneuraminate lyase
LTERDGVWGFPLTPFRTSGIDADLLAQATELQVAGAVDVLCACGLIAQLEQLTPDEHRHSVETVIAAAGGRVPVVVTVRAADGAPAAADHAAEHGAAGIVAVPTSPDPAAALTHLRAIAAAAPASRWRSITARRLLSLPMTCACSPRSRSCPGSRTATVMCASTGCCGPPCPACAG